jgi:Pectate lyase superfamily protein
MHSSIHAKTATFSRSAAIVAAFFCRTVSGNLRTSSGQYEWNVRAAVLVFVSVLGVASSAHAQGSRHDDIVFGTTGHPVAGATITVCQPTAAGTPCSPLATLYTDATLTTTSPNPFQTDGLGNYHFYAPAGRYLLQITGPGITGTIAQPDVILPPDVSSTGSGNNISAFGLNLGGNLNVAGNATISGTLTASGYTPGPLASLNITGNATIKGPRPYIDVTAYNASGSAQQTSATCVASNTNVTISSAIDFQNGQGIALPGCGSTPTVTAPTVHVANIGTTGSTTYSYSVATIDAAGGNSGYATFVSTSTGNATLSGTNYNAIYITPVAGARGYALIGRTSGSPGGIQYMPWEDPTSYTGSTAARASNFVTVTTSGTLSFFPTWFITMSGCSDSSFNGTFQVADTGQNTFSYSQTAANSSATGCTVTVNPTFFDFGTTLPFPSTTSLSFRTTSYPDILSTTICAGAGTTTLTLCSAPANSNGTTAYHDDTAAFQAAINAQHTAGSGTTLLCPNGTFRISSDLDISTGLTLNGSACTIDQINPGADVLRTTDSSGTTTYLSLNYIALQGGRIGIDASDQAALVVFTADHLFLNTFDGIRASQNGIQWTLKNLFCQTQDWCIDASPAATIQGLKIDVAWFSGVGNGVWHDVRIPNTFGYSASFTCETCLWEGPTASWMVNSATPVGARMVFGAVAPVVLKNGQLSDQGTSSVNFIQTLPSTNAAPVAIEFDGGYYVADTAAYLVNTLPGSTIGNLTFRDGVFDGGAGIWGGNAPLGVVNAGGFFSPALPNTNLVTLNAGKVGVGTASPAANLDVNGSAAVNSLNGVQMAERFSGSDAAAKINACLTAASTASGVCDAHGLTGSLTGSTHIQIPAGTTLRWGQAQLTINDTTNNDAVELLGDGSALVGDQESGAGTIPRADTSGFIACQPAGCTTVKNPNAATRNVDWVHITGMYLQATGAASTVLNLTSVGHADIENNRFVMGTGGASYGIFGDTSTGGFDSTNTLIKHNEFDPQFQNDRCLHLAGVFNVVEMEQNTCILPAANTGTVCFELAKDSSGNYPNNDEFYGNDCEGSSTSFNQIGYNIINADSVTIGPNNRCENVYNCFQFPIDGSAVGIHILDPYISVSANSVVKPNEPSTAQIAIDNNGPNWLPSMHYGINDVAGRNLLGNAAFEGWSGSTALYYWGGVTGTTINSAGSGIYAQNSSAGAPADSTTQGSYNVKIGDNATAGLGINSGCVQIDATMNYTLAFRIAASSTGINFRPGFRFYSDPNCTEADKITSVATNARVLAPTNYAGTSSLVGTGPNWQSSNASLTYNNGITCNCNVTGGDWQVATASTWTPTRNFAITFRVPNAYASSSTVAQSMRVFILENTAANPNQIFVDDAVLSEGPVSATVPLTAGISDSVNPIVYGNLAVNGALTVGASGLPAALTTGTPTAGNCAAFTSGTTTNIQDAGSPCPTLFTKFAMGFLSAGEAPSATNAIDVSVVYLPNIQFSHLTVDVSTTDSSTSDFYGWAITDLSGNVKCSITAVNLTAGGASDQVCTQGTITLPSGTYLFAFTGNATVAKIAYSGTAPLALSNAVSSSTSSSGAITSPISVPSAGVTYSGYGLPAIILH